MLSVTRKFDYALVALVELTIRGTGTASARELAEQLHVPPRALTNILNRLTHDGLVISVRGSIGGYALARHPEEITLAELMEAVEGPIRLTRCCPADGEAKKPKCDRESLCRVRESMHQVHAGLKDFLAQVTLSDLASDRVALKLRQAETGTDMPHERRADA